MQNEPRIAAMLKVKLHDRIGKQLLSAAHRDDVRAIYSLLREGADINWGNALGQTALHIACLWGNSSAAQALIENGVDVNRVNGERLGKQTPLHMLAGRTTNLQSSSLRQSMC